MLTRLVEDLRYRLGDSLAKRLDVSLPPSTQPIDVPAEPLRQALIALLRNAFDASDADQRVTMRVEQSDGVRVEVIDRGRGMDRSRSRASRRTVLHDQAGRRRAWARPFPGARICRSDGRHAAHAIDAGPGHVGRPGTAGEVVMSRIVPTILVVEDDDAFRTMLVNAFQERGYEAQGVADARRPSKRREHESPEMAVVDLRLPDQSGLEVVRELKAIDASTAIVVLTGYGSIATALESVRLGAMHYLTKPTDADRILAAFQHGLASRPRDLPTDPPSLARVEWEHLNRVLTDCDGNVSEAARQLGMHRRSLQRKLTKYPGPR